MHIVNIAELFFLQVVSFWLQATILVDQVVTLESNTTLKMEVHSYVSMQS